MRLTRPAVLVFLSTCLVSVPTRAQQRAPQRDPQAISILRSSYSALGGHNGVHIQDTHTVVQVRVFEDGVDVQQTATIDTAGRNLRFDNPTLGASLVVDGDQAIFKSAGKAPIHMSSLAVGNAGITHLPVFSAIADWANPAVTLQYLGVVPVGASSAHHIRMRRPLPARLGLREYDEPCDFYIDSLTFLPLKIGFVQRARRNRHSSIPVEVQYSDYRAVAGILVPFSVSYFLGETPQGQMAVVSFTVNQGTPPNNFQLN